MGVRLGMNFMRERGRMNTAEYFRKAMSIVRQKGIGDRIIFEIAKNHPSIVCKA